MTASDTPTATWASAFVPLTLERRPDGVGVTHQALSPKMGGGEHTMWWTGPDPARPRCAAWSTDPDQAVVFPDESAAVDAFTALGRPEFRLPAPQPLPGRRARGGAQ